MVLTCFSYIVFSLAHHTKNSHRKIVIVNPPPEKLFQKNFFLIFFNVNYVFMNEG